MKRIILLTGPPGIGKTTIFSKIIDEIEKGGFHVGGMICCEIRKAKSRVGFELLDLSSKKRGLLAHINQLKGPRIGKYFVNLRDLENLGVASILTAIKKADLIAIDEIGPMELLSLAFCNALIKSVESSKPLLSTVHYRLNAPLINKIKTNKDTIIFKLNTKNRESIHHEILEKIYDFLVRYKF